MRFENVEVNLEQAVQYGRTPNAVRGTLKKPVPPNSAVIQLTDGCFITVPVAELKLVKLDSQKLTKEFGKKFTKTLDETSGALREAAEQKNLKSK